MNPIKVSLFLVSAAFMDCPAWAQSMTELIRHTGGIESIAYAVSADGRTIVGYTEYGPAYTEATTWIDGAEQPLGSFGSTYAVATTTTNLAYGGYVRKENGNNEAVLAYYRSSPTIGTGLLGFLPGGTSSAILGLSTNGTVAVGRSTVGGQNRAIRWTVAQGMSDLGTLGGPTATAYGTSADGSVIVGVSSNGTYQRAFRWTAANGMTDIGTLAGTNSTARGVSADGTIVVGYSTLGIYNHAFRWSAISGMTDLGTLGGASSFGYAVSGDGTVVVGSSSLQSSGTSHAFSWTSRTGMVDLGTLPGDASSVAYGVSSDGNIVVGGSRSNSNVYRAFIYKSRVMLDVQDWLGSVGGVNSFLSASEELTRLHLEGAHHRPLADLGQGSSYWVTGDIASSSRSRDLLTRSGETGATFAPANNLLIGIGGGYGLQDQDLANAGSARIFGQYLVAEIDLIRPDGGIFSVLGSFGDWKDTYDRGYVTASGVDYSHGQTNLTSTAFRLRYDSASLGKAFGADFKAYVSYAHLKVASEAFAETGGSYAGSFGAMDHIAKEGRLGLTASKAFGESVKVRLSAEWIRRYDHDAAPLTATDITSTLALALPTPDPVRDQARAGVDMDYALDKRTTLSLTVHASGRGESPDVSGAISLRRSF